MLQQLFIIPTAPARLSNQAAIFHTSLKIVDMSTIGNKKKLIIVSVN